MVFVLRMVAKYSQPQKAGIGEKDEVWERWETCCDLKGHTLDVLHVAWCPKKHGRLASCGTDRNIFVWQVPQRDPVKRIATEQPCKGVAWDPMGKYLASQGQGQEKTVDVWRIRDWKLESTNKRGFESPDDTQFLRLSWSPDGAQLATTNAYEKDCYTCTVLKRSSGDAMRDDDGWERDCVFKGWKAPVTVASYHPKLLKKNGTMQFCFAIGCQEKKLTLWTTACEEKPLLLIKNIFDGEIYDVTWGGESQYVLAACSNDGCVALVKVSKDEPVCRIRRTTTTYTT